MELTLFIIIAWIIVAYFVSVLPSENLIRNLILYMVLIIFMTSVSTVISLDLGFIGITTNKVKYVAVIIYRNIITPLLLVIFNNIFSELKSYYSKIASITVILLLLSTLEFISLRLHLQVYIKWNFMLFILFYSVSILIAIITNKGLYAIQLRGELNK